MRNLSVRFLSIILAAMFVLALPVPSSAAVSQADASQAALSAADAARTVVSGTAVSEVAAFRTAASKTSISEADALRAASPSAGTGTASGLRSADASYGVLTDLVREGRLVRSGSRLRYRHSNGTYAKSAWITTGGKTYYFNKKSYAVTGLRKIGRFYYIFNSKGVVRKGWIKYKKKWYYGSVNKKGRLLTGWQKIGGKRYYLSVKTRYRLTGFQYIGGKMYYFNAKGVQQTSNQYVNGRYVVFNPNGSIYSLGSKIYGTYSAGKGQKVVDYAVQFVGNPYKWGGSSLTHGADCSGFVMAVYAHFGIQLPHYDASIRKCGREVKGGLANALPGDVICYDGHVAIYMGGGRIVHAADYQYGICIWNNAAYRPILSIRRFF